MENKAYEKDEEEVVSIREVENNLNESPSLPRPRDGPSRPTLLCRPHIEEPPSCLEDGILKIPSRNKCDLEVNREVEEEVEKEEEEEERNCGIFGFYPKCLQKHANSMAFLAIFCVQSILQGAAFSVVSGSNTSLERHFRFSSKDLGSLIMLGEIGPMLLSLVVSRFGGKSHRPHFMGGSLAIVALGFFVGFSTFLVYPPPVHTESGQLATNRKFCRPQDVASYLIHGATTAAPSPRSSSSDVDESCSRSSNLAYFLWFFSFTLNAVGATSIYTVGMSYLDDSIEKKEAPTYFAISIAVRVLGQILGFSLSSALLNMYIYPGHEYGITPEDSRWIGAWWIGSLAFSLIAFLLSFVIALFPRDMYPMKDVARKEPSQLDLPKKESIEGSSLKDFFKKFLKGEMASRLTDRKPAAPQGLVTVLGNPLFPH